MLVSKGIKILTLEAKANNDKNDNNIIYKQVIRLNKVSYY